MNPREDLYRIALTMIPHVGAVIAKNLISYCGGIEAVFKENKRALLKVPGVGPTLAQRVLDPGHIEKAQSELENVRKHGIDLYFFTDEKYPRRLRPFPQSPILLYGKGNLDLNAPRILSVVGTRGPSGQGKLSCERIVRSLQSYGVTILSGLAYGIDITAHRSCLSAGVPTIGVLGSGFGKFYPPIHWNTANRMMETGGILTGFTFETAPEKENFPARNTIVATLADAVFVVESADKGGSMITSEIANSCNKDVFALPGRIGDRMSKGCNGLIRDHKAQLVTSAEDIAGFMRWKELSSESLQRELFVDLDEREQLVCALLQEEKVRDIDTLSYFARLKSSEISAVLLSLEFKGVIKALPGKRFTLTSND
jgi:DNA processing protein